MSSVLEKVAYKLVPETQSPDVVAELDERFLATPSIALERCHELSVEMAREAIESIRKSIMCLRNYTPELAKEVRELEDKTDHYEDIIGTYLVKLSTHQVSDAHSAESSKLLKIIGDLERISDHAVNIVVSSEEMNEKKLTFSDSAEKELDNLLNATDEILSLTLESVEKNDASLATDVEPLEEIIDKLKESLRTGHIIRLQQKTCSIETGFVWSDILTNLERVSDHCSNVAGCIIDALAINLNIHESLRATKAEDPHFKEKYSMYAKKYLTAVNAEK